MFDMNKSIQRGAAIACALGGIVGLLPAQTSPPLAHPKLVARASSSPKMTNRHRSAGFVENKGQWDARARYMSHFGSVNTWLTTDGFVFDYLPSLPKDGKSTKLVGHAVQMNFVGAQPYKLTPQGKAASRNDYIKRAREIHGAMGYKAVYATDVYKGIDLRTLDSAQGSRWDLLVKPNADPTQVALKFDGVKSVSVNSQGDLVYSTSIGQKKLTSLQAYQYVSGKKKPVSVAFNVTSNNTVGFRLGAYDKSQTLVIDPLIYGSYFGSDIGDDEVHGVVSDTQGAVYMTGTTKSTTFPAQNGTHGLLGNQDAFITRFQGDAYNIDYNAYVGGTGSDDGLFIASSPKKDYVWIAGITNSTDLPGVNTDTTKVLQQTPGPYFFMKFPVNSDATLGDPITSYFGGDGTTIEMDTFKISPVLGNVVIGGLAIGSVPGPNAHPQAGQAYVYVTVIDPTGVTPRYNTYLGSKDPSAQIWLGVYTQNAVGNWPVPIQGNGLAVKDYKFYDANNVEYAQTQIALTGMYYAPETFVDTTINRSYFPTYPIPSDNAGRSLWPNGTLIRGDGSHASDAYVAKYSFSEPTGDVRPVDANGLKTVYAGLLGGTQSDYGVDVDLDPSGNAYVLAESSSFDYPRTRGVIGENNLITINVTKIDNLGTSLLYSTGLNAQNSAWSNGISVDNRGVATITGGVSAVPTWPTTPGNPNAPNGEAAAGSVMTGGTGVIKSAPTRNGTDTIPTADGWINVINSTATSLLYGSYLGASNNDWVYKPYVEAAGDIWLFGWTDSFMFYQVPGNGTNPGTPKQVAVFSALPSGHITALAWKNHPDLPNDAQHFNGAEEVETWAYRVPSSISVFHRRDGYVMRFRVGLPSVSSVVLGRNTAPGGLGVKVPVTVNLDSAALTGGADVVLSLDSTVAASFSPTSDVDSISVHINEGATSPADIPYVYTKGVSSNTGVQVQGTYEGTYKIVKLTVIPWLQQLTLTPTNIIGGAQVTARVTLAEAAPTGGVPVTFTTTPSPALIVVPATAQTIAAGLSTTTFTLETNGVATATTASLIASVADRELAQYVTITPAKLASLTFSPATVARGAVSTGTVALNGKAGSTFKTLVHISNAPGYLINGVDATTGDVAVTIPQNATSGTFTVTTPVVPTDASEANDTSRIFTVTQVAQAGYTTSSVQNTLYVQGINLGTLSLNPTSVSGAATVTGTLTLKSPAPAGGATIYLFTSNKSAADFNGSATSTITIGEGKSTAQFTLNAYVVANKRTVTITAALAKNYATEPRVGRLTAVLSMAGTSVTNLAISPSSVIGGVASAGTITLDNVAPSTGVAVTITSSDTSVAVPSVSTLTISGSNTGSFGITTYPVTSPKTVTFTIQAPNGTTTTSTLVVKPVGVASIKFKPTSVRGTGTTVCTVTLEAPAPADGTLTFKLSNSGLLLGLTSQAVSKGTTTITVRATAARVVRTLTTTVTATFNGTSQSAVVTVTR